MAILKIVTYGNESLRQKSKEISKISKKIRILAVFVIDVSLDNEPYNPIVFINPKIIKKEGATHEKEGCLSFPNAFVDVRRYSYVKVKALDINGKPFIMEAKDGSLLSRAIQHEYDHLEGILFIDHSRNIFEAIKVLEENNLPTVQKDKMLDEKDIEDLLSNEDNKADNNE